MGKSFTVKIKKIDINKDFDRVKITFKDKPLKDGQFGTKAMEISKSRFEEIMLKEFNKKGDDWMNGTKYCKGCIHFHDTLNGSYCMLNQFESQYTKDCNWKKVL